MNGGTTVVGSNVYIAGGILFDGTNSLNTVRKYDIKNDSWSDLPSIRYTTGARPALFVFNAAGGTTRMVPSMEYPVISGSRAMSTYHSKGLTQQL